jgi:hypothetical protein
MFLSSASTLNQRCVGANQRSLCALSSTSGPAVGYGKLHRKTPIGCPEGGHVDGAYRKQLLSVYRPSTMVRPSAKES